LKNRVNRGGILAPGASLMKDGENGRGLSSRWYVETLCTRIANIASQREDIHFVHGDGIEYIERNSGSRDVAFFVDPPYTVAGRRLYTHSDIDHHRLFEVLSGVRGDFLMTYDATPEITELARQFGFDTAQIPMKTTHHDVKMELLIG